MKVQKSILKTCAVLMAAEMALSPVTVKAGGLAGWIQSFGWWTLEEKSVPIGETGIAEEGVYYKMPSCNYAYNAITGEEGYRNGIVYVDFARCSSDVGVFGTVPNGYKGILTSVGYLWTEYDNEGWEDSQNPCFSWAMDIENGQNYVELDDGYVKKWNFTVDCDGVTYSECWVAVCLEAGGGTIEAVVPQQYNGAVPFTINGMKLENGETVMDEETSLTYYLQGNGTSTMQPTSPEPTADQQPAEQTADPQPAEQTADPQPAEPAADTAAEKYNTYVTKPGDSLMKLAKELYGDKKQWTAIYELNKDKIKNPNVIYANMELVLP